MIHFQYCSLLLRHNFQEFQHKRGTFCQTLKISDVVGGAQKCDDSASAIMISVLISFPNLRANKSRGPNHLLSQGSLHDSS